MQSWNQETGSWGKTLASTAALVPRVRASADELRGFRGNYASYVRAEQLRTQIEALKSQLDEFESAPDKAEKLEFVKLTANTMADVCARIRELFIAWEMAEDVTVAFDEKGADLLVSGRKRTSHGKGVRAVMCAGYVIGLMQQALAANGPVIAPADDLWRARRERNQMGGHREKPLNLRACTRKPRPRTTGA